MGLRISTQERKGKTASKGVLSQKWCVGEKKGGASREGGGLEVPGEDFQGKRKGMPC